MVKRYLTTFMSCNPMPNVEVRPETMHSVAWMSPESSIYKDSQQLEAFLHSSTGIPYLISSHSAIIFQYIYCVQSYFISVIAVFVNMLESITLSPHIWHSFTALTTPYGLLSCFVVYIAYKVHYLAIHVVSLADVCLSSLYGTSGFLH
jgi:hypothetical protein